MNDKNRNGLRRLSERNVSNQSIITIIERFVQSVNTMEDTILIPSKLMDKQVGDSNDSIKSQKNHNSRGVRDNFSNTDLLNLYNSLASAKVDLLWGHKIEEIESQSNVVNGRPVAVEKEKVVVDKVADENEQVAAAASGSSSTLSENSARNQNQRHVRCPSTVSVSSSNSGSSTISDYETEVSSNDNDSGVESDGKKKKSNCQELEEKFRFHLIELQKSLESMTETANYLTSRYQSEVGSEHC